MPVVDDMKVGSLPGRDITSFFASTPMKIWLYIGWFLGIFPMKFDKSLMQFEFKMMSFTTGFAWFRLFLICVGPLLPGFVLQIINEVEIYNQNVTNTTNSVENFTEPFHLNITDISTWLNITSNLTDASNIWWNSYWQKVLTAKKLEDSDGYFFSKFELLAPLLGIVGMLVK